jgi:hypothetical protein
MAAAEAQRRPEDGQIASSSNARNLLQTAYQNRANRQKIGGGG